MTDHKPIKTVSIIGLGAIGSFFAFQLKAVLGDRLRIIAGGERKDRLEREGVTVNGVNHHFHIVSPDQDCGGDYPDLAIIITKFPALSQAIKDMKNQIGPDTLIMAPLNGVEAEDMVASVYGWDNLLYSLAKVSVVMKDGQASFKPDAARIEFGEKRNQVITPRVRAVKELFEAAGICCVVPEDMERAIESRCLSLILRQQPVASDLRQVSTALKVVTDLERIGDHASDIAELILRIKSEHAYHIVKHLPVMAASAQKMVHDAIEAFIAQDLESALEIIDRDDEVDMLFNQVKTDVIELLKSAPGQADQGIDLLMVAKYLERIGDHAVNVCEWTQFSKTGTLKNVRIM